MPRIDELEAAPAVADDDALPLSQNGQSRKATRAQMVAGLQPALALGAGQLLGRTSAGVGAPEAVSLGANLALAGGTLSAVTTPLDVPALPAGAMPSAGDLVPLSQGGRNVGVPYARFMAGLGGVGGVDISAGQVRPVEVARALGDVLADAVSVESFGARGDGSSDDTAALAAAAASGRPVLLGPRTYVVNGQWAITQPGTVLLGVPGLSVLKRLIQAGNGAWIAVQADRFRADGVIFDANGSAVAVESWGVLVTGLCAESDFHRCAFRNASGATLGSGLVIQASDTPISRHVVRDCEFSANAAHGLWVQACAGVLVEGCRAHDNAQYGIAVDFNDAAFVKKARLVQVLGNRCWNNQRGISIGNYNATNTQPPVWGNDNPDAICILAAENICHDNAIYGISASGQALSVRGNLVANNGAGVVEGAGILANLGWSVVSGNMVTGGATYGIDCGGSVHAEIGDNYISGGMFGINCGGGSFVRVVGNSIEGSSAWAVCANNVETDGLGQNFGMACNGLAIVGNWIGMTGAGAGGVLLRDGPANVLMADNHFTGTGDVGRCLWANTDSVIVERNRFNFTARFICNPVPSGAGQMLVYPDIADAVMVTDAPGGVQSMISSYQARVQGQLSFVRVTASGSGYTHASVSIGGAGSGAAAAAVISNGAVIGVVVTSAGAGYGAVGASVPVSISGDGAGAAATGYAAPPLPEERRLLIRCNTAVRFSRAGSQPLQENWTLADITVPANANVEWTGSWGSWRAGWFPAAATG
jgi:hypothetical protein